MKRTLLGVVVLLAGLNVAQAQTVSLGEAPLPKSCFRNELSMEMAGKFTLQQEGKNITLKQFAAARHDFLERILEAKDGLAEKSARIYQSAAANIAIDADVTKLAFRPEHQLMISQRLRNQCQTYCPGGLLTQEEKELTEHFDTLALPGLLPGKNVAVGESWNVPANVILAVCELDGIITGSLTGKLNAVQGNLADGTVFGVIKGIGMGAQISMEVNARFTFDLKEKRLVALEWKQHDERLQGPVSPALNAEVVYKLKRTPIAEPNQLSEIALVRALSAPADKMCDIVYRDPQGRFGVQYGRVWHLVGRDDKHLVLRLLSERGDFVAQATLTPFTKEIPGKMMDIDDFARLMIEAPGWEQDGNLLEKNAKVEVAPEQGIKAYRVGAAGKLGAVQAIQYYHLLTGPRGDQLIVTFTMDPSQVSNLTPHDMNLLRSITFTQGNVR